MASYYVLRNVGLPTSETITVRVEDGQALSLEYAAAGWSIVSSSSDPGSPAGIGFNPTVAALRSLLDTVYAPTGGGGSGPAIDDTTASGSKVYSSVKTAALVSAEAATARAAETANATAVAGGVLPTRVASLTPATTSAAPTVQRLNLYDATSGNLTPALPAAASVAAGVVVGFKKTDATANLVSPTCAGSDHIGSATGSTSIPIRLLDQITYLASDGVSVWTKVSGDLSMLTQGKVHLMDFVAASDHAGVLAGTTSITAAFTAALAALPSVSDPQDYTAPTGQRRGQIILPAGNLLVAAALPNVGPYVSVRGQGRWITFLNYTAASGACLTKHSTHYPSGGTFGFMSLDWGGDLSGFTIDGTGAGGSAIGLDYGDLEDGHLDVGVQNFTGATAVGFRFANDTWWTEKIKGRVLIKNCTQSAVFTKSGGTSGTSMAYNDLEIVQFLVPGQQGVTLSGGVRYYGGRLRVSGNARPGTYSQNNGKYALGLYGASTRIEACRFDFQMEGAATDSTNTTNIQTVYFDQSGSFISGAGVFYALNLAKSNAVVTAGQFLYSGSIVGDVQLNPGNTEGPTMVGGSTRGRGLLTGGTMDWSNGDMFELTLSANLTITAANVLPYAERVVMLTQATSGAYTVTWPASWQWSNGSAPTMPTTAGAVLVVTARTGNGNTVYASAAVAGSGSGASTSLTEQDEGVVLPTRSVINFVGAGVTAADNPAQGRTDVTIPGSVTSTAGATAGGSGTIAGAYSQSVSNSTSATVVATLGLPTSVAVKAGDLLRVKAGGLFANSSGNTASFQVDVYLGASLLATMSPALASAASNARHWAIDADIAVEATNIQHATTKELITSGAAVDANFGNTNSGYSGVAVVDATEDLTSASSVTIRVTLSVAATTVAATLRAATLEIQRR